jgi:hypothetical protein
MRGYQNKYLYLGTDIRDSVQMRDSLTCSNAADPFQFSDGKFAVSRVGHIDSRKHLHSGRRLECSEARNKFLAR